MDKIEKAKTKIAEMRSAIDKMNANKTAETALTVETAIEVLALPEIKKLEKIVAEEIGKKNLEKFLNK